MVTHAALAVSTLLRSGGRRKNKDAAMKPYRYCATRKKWVFSNGVVGTYRHFYYFSTPLKRWLAFQRLLHRFGFPLPKPVEHGILRILDALIELNGLRPWR
jgi:hypothetical protein